MERDEKMRADEMISFIKTGEKDDASLKKDKNIELSKVLKKIINDFSDDAQEYIFDRLLDEVKDTHKHKYIMKFLDRTLYVDICRKKKKFSPYISAKMAVLYGSSAAFFYSIGSSSNKYKEPNIYMFLAIALVYDIDEYKPEPCKIKEFMATFLFLGEDKDKDIANYFYELCYDDPSDEGFYNFWEDIEDVNYRSVSSIKEGKPIFFFSDVYITFNDSKNSKKIWGTLENFESFITYKCKNEKILDLIKDKMPEAVAKAKERLRKEHTKA